MKKIFFCFFSFYLIMGLCISYTVNVDIDNLFFGADSSRVFRDLTCITGDHYRVKVHPLVLLLLQPAELIINGIVNNSRMSVIIMESFSGAMSIIYFNKILNELLVSKNIKNIITMIYGMTFSMMIFSSIPETFIFAGLGLVSFWYYVLKVSKSSNPFCKEIMVLLVFFGVITFGITLTNYMAYMIGLSYLFAISGLTYKEKIRKFIKINIFNMSVIFLLSIVQKLIWIDSPLWLESIVMMLLGAKYEETKYMNWEKGFEKLKIWINQTILHPILSSNLSFTVEEDNAAITFGVYNMFLHCILGLFIIVFIVVLIMNLIRLRSAYCGRKDGYFVAILGSLVANLMLHYIYGYSEAFIYSPHYIFLFLILLAVGINQIKNTNIKNILEIFLGFFLVVQVVNNLISFIVTANIVLCYMETSILLIKIFLGFLICVITMYTIGIGIERLQNKFNLAVTALDQKNEIELLLRNIKLYFVTILICGFFISYNYDGIRQFIAYYDRYFDKIIMQFYNSFPISQMINI